MDRDIEQAHARLHYEEYEDRLRALKGLWAQLQKMKQAAPAQYIASLDMAIANLRKREVANRSLTEDELNAAWSDLDSHWKAGYTALSDPRNRIPSSVVGWVEKWAPYVHATYIAAHVNWLEHPSSVSLKAFKEAMTALFGAYGRP